MTRTLAPQSRTHESRHKGRIFWSKPFQDLIDAPAVLPLLEAVLGDPALGHAVDTVPANLQSDIRLDHDNIRAPTRRECRPAPLVRACSCGLRVPQTSSLASATGSATAAAASTAGSQHGTALCCSSCATSRRAKAAS